LGLFPFDREGGERGGRASEKKKKVLMIKHNNTPRRFPTYATHNIHLSR
jgi:hypothetical protein